MLTRLADALADPARGAAAAAAGPLPGGAGRRVPGHRPGAVADPARGLPRIHHPGADRRPEAGDLRVPRGRCRQLSRRHRGCGPPRHAGPQLAQRRGPARRARHGVRRGGARRPADHGAPRRVRSPRAADCAARRSTRRSGCAWPSRAGLPRPPRRDLAVVGPARELVARDAASDIAALLASGATVDGVPVAPGDVAVLVRTNDQGAMIRQTLAAAGVPAVLSGTASVFGTPIAGEWLTLLEALEQPRAFRVRAAALTCFLGRTVAELCGPDADTLLDEIGATLRGVGGGAARARRRRAAGSDHHRHRAARPLARRHRRRAAAHRPASRRPGAARRRGSRATSARPRWWSGCATASPTPPRTWWSSAAGGWSPTPRPSRSSRSTAARAWSSPSSTCLSRGTATSATRTSRCCTTSTAPGCSTSVASPATGGRSGSRDTAPRRRARICGCSTSRSPGRAARWSPGGCRRRPRPPHRCTGC